MSLSLDNAFSISHHYFLGLATVKVNLIAVIEHDLR